SRSSLMPVPRNAAVADRRSPDTPPDRPAGSLFGPHGGVLDRLDAVLFTVIVGYYLVKLFGF
ncbi:MAG: hypothetical protein ACKOPI_04515, partial [bacterium]